MRAVVEAAGRGVPVLGVCNGFQVADRGGAAARRADAQRGPALRLPHGAADGREQPVAVHRGLRGRAADPICRSRTTTATTSPTRRRSTGSKAKAAWRSAMPSRSTARRATSPGVLNEAGNVLGMMPHPERAIEAGARRHRRAGAVRERRSRSLVDAKLRRRAAAGCGQRCSGTARSASAGIHRPAEIVALDLVAAEVADQLRLPRRSRRLRRWCVMSRLCRHRHHRADDREALGIVLWPRPGRSCGRP